MLSADNPTDDKSDYDDNRGELPTNPNGSEHPNPCPINDLAQFKDDKGDAEKSRKAGEVNVDVLVFHVIVLSGFVSVSLHFMYTLYH